MEILWPLMLVLIQGRSSVGGASHSAVGPVHTCSPINEISTCLPQDEHVMHGRKLDSLTPAMLMVFDAVPNPCCGFSTSSPYIFCLRIEARRRVMMRPCFSFRNIIVEYRIRSKGATVVYSCANDKGDVYSCRLCFVSHRSTCHQTRVVQVL